MTLIASGINKILTFGKQSGLGTIAVTSLGTAQNLRRTQSTLNKTKASYTSKEIRPSQQHADFRLGVVGVAGTISGELSVGTYQHFFESICRSAVLSAVTSGALTDVTAASTGTATGTFTSIGAAFITEGFKVGMIIRWTGWTTTGAANGIGGTGNNAVNYMITGLTAGVMTVVCLNADSIPSGTTGVVAKASGDSVTALEVGKHVMPPLSGQTRDYYTIEHWFADVQQSEVFTDCVITQADVKLPASGFAAVDFQVKGRDMIANAGGDTPGSTTPTTGIEYFTAALSVSTGTTVASANGVMYLNGLPVALITAMNFSIKGGHTMIGGTVGSNIEPDIFPGDISVDGQVTVLFQDNVVRDYFLNETEVSILCAFTANVTGSSGAIGTVDFTSFAFPRVKLSGSSKDDGEKGLVMTMPFTALENIYGGAATNSQWTSIVIQDSKFT